jgi:hypothetical protein
MNKSKVEQTLKTGTSRQKIKLYMEDVALFNTFYIETREPALTPTQRKQIEDLLLFSTERPYYEKLRKWNKGMMFFKTVLTLELSKLYQTYLHLDSKAVASTKARYHLQGLNALLDLYPNKKTRDKALSLAYKSNVARSVEKYQENGKTYLRATKELYKDEIEGWIKEANNKTWLVKSYISLLKYMTDRKRLPVKAYRDLIKHQEKELISLYEKCYHCAIIIDRNRGIKKARAIPPYEKIEAEVTKEDLEELEGILAQ